MFGLNPWVLLTLGVAWLASCGSCIVVGIEWQKGQYAQEQQELEEQLKLKAKKQRVKDTQVIQELNSQLQETKVTLRRVRNAEVKDSTCNMFSPGLIQLWDTEVVPRVNGKHPSELAD